MPDYYTGNFYLNDEQMKVNASYLWAKMGALRWSINAVAGMLGNMQSESSINPGIWQNLDEGNLNDGYGLVQWTPASKYIDWANSNGYALGGMEGQIARFDYEVENQIQWYATANYPISFAEFKSTSLTPYNAAMAFLECYERPENPNQPHRGTQAEYWYTYLMNEPPPPPPPTRETRKMPLLYYLRLL